MSADTDTSVDWALLEAEMPAVPCEHKYHDDPSQAAFHSGPATHYYQSECQYCGNRPGISAVCGTFVAQVLVRGSQCMTCGNHNTAAAITTLQPIRAAA